MWTAGTAQRHCFCGSPPLARKEPQLCNSSTKASTGSTMQTPRQRKLAAKRKQKQEQRVVTPVQQSPNGSSSSSSSHANKQVHHHQQQQQQQQPPDVLAAIPSIKQPAQQQQQQQQYQQQGLPASIVSLAALILQQQQQQQQQQQHIAAQHLGQVLQILSADQLSQLMLLWAQESRNMLLSDMEAAEALLHCYVTAAKQQLEQGGFERQQLADVAWGLAHFDGLDWRCRQQQQQQQQWSSQSQQQQQQQQGSQLPLHWCGPFQEALGVPFVIVPNIMPDLQITAFMTEITLQRDVIYLTDGKGEIKAVPEARLTGWQSDVGATFKYSGKEMVPETGLTPEVAKVRDVLAAATGVHYDSVLINYYADGKCGMRYHVDPLYGKWTSNSAVVSLGDTRQFVFRRIDDHSIRWAYKVSNGDVVVMFDDCQDILQHAIKVEATAGAVGPRISLVYKQRIKNEDGSWA